MASPVISDSHRDLLESDTAILATNGPDGRPQLSAVWFLAEDDVIRVSLHTSRQKVKNLEAHPGVTFFILDPAAPTRYLEVRGDAEIADDSDYTFAHHLGAKYQADLRAYDGSHPGRVVVTIRPTRVNAVDIAGD